MMPTLAAVFLVTVVHAVKNIVAAPTPRDAVCSVQTEELVLPTLFHAANLSGREGTGFKAFHPFTYAPWEHSLMFEWITGYCGFGKERSLRTEPRWRSGGGALTSSEPSRQLSCPSHRRLADTQPPLAHTYSLTEHVGRTGKAAGVSQLADLYIFRALTIRVASQETPLFRFMR